MSEDTVGKLFDKIDELARMVARICGKLDEKEKSWEDYKAEVLSLSKRVNTVEIKLSKQDGVEGFFRNWLPIAVSIVALAATYFK